MTASWSLFLQMRKKIRSIEKVSASTGNMIRVLPRHSLFRDLTKVNSKSTDADFQKRHSASAQNVFLPGGSWHYFHGGTEHQRTIYKKIAAWHHRYGPPAFSSKSVQCLVQVKSRMSLATAFCSNWYMYGWHLKTYVCCSGTCRYMYSIHVCRST